MKKEKKKKSFFSFFSFFLLVRRPITTATSRGKKLSNNNNRSGTAPRAGRARHPRRPGHLVDPRQRAKAKKSSDPALSLPRPRRRGADGGEEFLHYLAPEAIDVALLRGTVADADGNVGFGREALLGGRLNQAIAAHNSWHRKEMRER